MTRIAYEVYYDYDAIVRRELHHSKLSEKAVKEYVDNLKVVIEALLDDSSSSVSIAESVSGKTFIFISSEKDASTVDKCMEKALLDSLLVATRLDNTGEIIIKS